MGNTQSPPPPPQSNEQPRNEKRSGSKVGYLIVAFLFGLLGLIIIGNRNSNDSWREDDYVDANYTKSVADQPREPTLPAYEEIQREDFLDTKLSIDVRITEPYTNLPGPRSLEALSEKLYAAYSGKKYERTFIFYYLPGMIVDSGAWATGHYDPDLEIEVIGVSPKLAKHAMTSNPRIYPGEVLVGRWLFQGSLPTITTIVRGKDTYILRTRYDDLNMGDDKELDVRNVSGRRRYSVKGSREYYVIDERGDLGGWDSSDGLIATGKYIDNLKGIQGVKLPLNQASLVEGMTYSEVCGLIGQEGTERGSLTGADGVQTAKYNWDDEEGNLEATFRNDSLTKWNYEER